jgi:hypothetical protein
MATSVYDDENVKQNPNSSKPDLARQEEAYPNRAGEDGADEDTGRGATSAEELAKKEEDAASHTEEDDLNYTGGQRGNSLSDNAAKQFLGKSSDIKKYAIFGGILGTIGFMAAAIMILFMLAGNLKEIHFATVLRSVGMARFSYTINRQLSLITLQGATLTGESTGKYQLDRNLLEKVSFINPEKALTKLGREGTMKFTFDGSCKWACLKQTNTFRSVTIDGKEFKLSDFTNGNDYNKLSVREKLTVQNDFAKAIQNSLADRLSIENRAFRSSTFNGLRKVTGISMTKWANKARDFIGKSVPEARKLNTQETVDRISGNGGAESSIDAVRMGEEAQKDPTDPAKAEAAKAAREKGVNLADSLGKASIAVLAATTGCIIHDLNTSFIQANLNWEQGKARVGHDALTAADQTKTGDVTSEAISAENERWNNAEDSYYYKASTGQSTTTADQTQLNSIPSPIADSGFAKTISALENIIDTTTSSGLSNIAPIGEIQDNMQTVGCSIVLNPAVQYTTAVAEIAGTTIASFFTAGGAAAGDVALHAAILTSVRGAAELGASVGVGELVGTLIDKSIESYTSFSGAETGANLYNTSAVGVNYLEQTGTRQINYGRPLSAEEASSADTVALQSLKSSYANSSFTDRYFAISNPFSVTGSIIASLPTDAPSLITFTQHAFGSLLQLPSTLLSSFLSGKAFAADQPGTVDYSAYSKQYGWTPTELARLSSDESFAADPLTKFYVDHQNDTDSGGNNLFNQYLACYSAELQKDIPSYCTGDFLGTDTALHWRAYNAYYTLADWSSADDLGIRSASPAGVTN